MKKTEFLNKLREELEKRNVADAADILEEYEQHFMTKSQRKRKNKKYG